MISEYFEKKKTAYGGRGLFALKPIPPNTLIHASCSPYASVIYREYRKEVCAYCFSYSFEANRGRTWNIKLDPNGTGGVRFCSIECKDTWRKEEDVDNMIGQMNISIEQFDQKTRQAETRSNSCPLPSNLQKPDVDISQGFVDAAWKTSENEAFSGEPLDSLELDLVRFLASGLIHRCIEDSFQQYPESGSTQSFSCQFGTWSELLDLQNKEYATPRVLNRHLRAYKFLRQVAIPALKPYVRDSDLVRAILGRDQSNAFGIFEVDGDDMLGYGLFPSASYFNHG